MEKMEIKKHSSALFHRSPTQLSLAAAESLLRFPLRLMYIQFMIRNHKFLFPHPPQHTLSLSHSLSFDFFFFWDVEEKHFTFS